MNRRPKQTEATKKRILDAFIEAAHEKGVQRVTVRDVTNIAEINRSTFYQYYIDIKDLIEQYENTLLEQVLSSFEAFSQNKTFDVEKDLFKMALHIFQHFGDEVYFLLGDQGDPAFQHKLRSFLMPIFKKYFFSDAAEIPNFEYILAFTMSAINGTLTHWHESGQTITDDEIISLIEKLLRSGLSRKVLFWMC